MGLVPRNVGGLAPARFTELNDTYGHEARDQVLQRVTGTLRHTPEPGDVIGRLGGDEFVILLPRPADPRPIGAKVCTALAEQSAALYGTATRARMASPSWAALSCQTRPLSTES